MKSLRFRKMTKKEFTSFLEVTIPDYAKSRAVVDHLSYEEALKNAHQAFKKLLPKGLKTQNHHLYSVLNKKDWMGWVWISILGKTPSTQKIYIYYLYLFPDFRGKGFGIDLLNFVEKKAEDLGINRIELHVFGDNKIARKLYKKLGYHETSVMMEKLVKAVK